MNKSCKEDVDGIGMMEACRHVRGEARVYYVTFEKAP